MNFSLEHVLNYEYDIFSSLSYGQKVHDAYFPIREYGETTKYKKNNFRLKGFKGLVWVKGVFGEYYRLAMSLAKIST